MTENNDWIQVYSTNTEIDAELIKQNLENNDIPANILSQVDSTRQFTVGFLAIVKIFVEKNNYDKAKEIIDAINNGEFEIN
ncbi:MAG: DUF2007 domain-containing protein [Candidatus Kapaibacteriota bacterium]|jgi:hypothetical protein